MNICLFGNSGVQGQQPPLQTFLKRQSNKKDFDLHFSDAQRLLKDIVNYGTNLLPRCYVSSKRKHADGIILGVLSRQVITMVDSAEILISNGAVYASKLQMRALVETILYLDFIIKSDTERKARYYYVSNLRNEKIWALRVMGESPDQKFYDDLLSTMGKDVLEKSRKNSDQGKQDKIEINRVLSKNIYKDIDQEFENYKSKHKLKHEPNWLTIMLKV